MKRYNVFFLSLLIAFTMNLICADLDSCQAQLLVKHLDVLRELKTKFAAKRNSIGSNTKKRQQESQTNNHRRFSSLNKIINENWGSFLASHKKLIDSIIECEQQHTDDYYVFYHAQRQEWRVYEDFLKQVYEYMQVNCSLHDFHFLRFWANMPATVDANTFIDENEKKAYWNDLDDGMYNLLLSANLALFGNCTEVSGCCCTFDYFMRSYSMTAIDINAKFGEVFDFFGFDKKYIDQLVLLKDLIKTNEGTLFQVFIPKNLVDRCAYLAYALGHPYDKVIPGADFNEALKRYKTISKPLDVYRKISAPIKLVPVKKYKKKKTKKIVTKSDASNNAYIIDKMQARIIFSQDMMLNPDSGIKIYRYTTVEDSYMAVYEKQLKELTRRIFIDWLQHANGCNAMQNSRLKNLYCCLQAEKEAFLRITL
jgi:hypothetical protein